MASLHSVDIPPVQHTSVDAASIYRINDWSQGYFSIDEQGDLLTRPTGLNGPSINLKEVITALSKQGIQTPVLLRFSDILDHRLRSIKAAFDRSIEENNYHGQYIAAYPIKVNQQHQLVEEVVQFGDQLGFGLEVGSKPELLAVIAMTVKNPNQIIICNGFKDAQYIEAVILARKLGRQIIPVVENLSELDLILESAKKHNVRPQIGVRIKLASAASGRWASSVGIKGKFGLTIDQLLQAMTTLQRLDMLDCLDLLHCHSGSQHQNILTIKSAITELTHIFVQLKQLGARLTYIDIGGGLGVDYQGSSSDQDSSMNYTLEEYASDVVYRIGSICDASQIEHPTIITECGRAMVAYSSVLIFDILGSASPSALIDHDLQPQPPNPTIPQPIIDLNLALESIREPNPRLPEIYHDTLLARQEALTLFSLGYLTLEQRAQTERLFWTTCSLIQQASGALDEPSDVLSELDDLMSETYFANFSIFQSLPDLWAINQLFPIMPIHRLDETPSIRATISDITCDSDGRIDSFISASLEHNKTLPLHTLDPSQPYYLGAFLVGAYQETLGDLHNLFGDPHAVHIRLDGDDWSIQEIVQGDTISEVLSYVQYDPEELIQILKHECDQAVNEHSMSMDESITLTQFYQAALAGNTYLQSTYSPAPSTDSIC